MNWRVDKYKREWEDWRTDRERFAWATREWGHAFVNLFVEGIRHHAYTIGHVLVVLVIVGLVAAGYILAGGSPKPPY